MRLATIEDFSGDRTVEELRYARLVASNLSGDPSIGLQVYEEMIADPRGFTAALQVLLVEIVDDVTLSMTANHTREAALEGVRATIAKIEGNRHHG